MLDSEKTKDQLIEEVVALRSRLQRFESGDISGEKTAKLTCEASEFYLSILNDAPALIWRAALDAKCDWFNSTWLAFTGRDLSQELGDGWAEGVHPEDFQSCLATYLDAFHARRFFEMEYRLRRHDGEYRWILDIGCPFKAPDGDFGGYIGYCYDITERKQLETELIELATTDPLTGVSNRRHFLKRAQEELHRAIRYGSPSALVLMDIDGFKTINDTFGHDGGDLVLKCMTDTCINQLRATDLFARLGGDEFAILLVQTDIISGIQTLKRMQDGLELMNIHIEGKAVNLTVSAGITGLRQDDNKFEEVLKRADLALYGAKRSGKNQVVTG